MAAETVTLQFGPLRKVQSRGREGEVGDYALHIQCAHAVNEQGRGVGDVRDVVGRLGPLPVVSVSADASGKLVLEFPNDVSLLVSPVADASDEQWRLLKPGSDEPHLVYGGGRYYEE